MVDCVICGEGGRVQSGERVWVCAACWAMVVWEGYARTREGGVAVVSDLRWSVPWVDRGRKDVALVVRDVGAGVNGERWGRHFALHLGRM